jgi:hypothetical protein
MKSALGFTVAAVFVGLTVAVGWLLLRMLIQRAWPVTVPESLGFTKEVATQLPMREVAEQLAERFKLFNGGEVVCLGPVRGNAARVLFHSGRKNKRGNIHRPDYMVQVERKGDRAVRLRLVLNQPYSYLRINKAEVGVLRERLANAFGGLDTL